MKGDFEISLVFLLEGQAGQGVSISILDTGPVFDFKVKILQEQDPARGLTLRLLPAKQPLEGLVVSDQSELDSLQIESEGFDIPNYCKQFTLVGEIEFLLSE